MLLCQSGNTETTLNHRYRNRFGNPSQILSPTDQVTAAFRWKLPYLWRDRFSNPSLVRFNTPADQVTVPFRRNYRTSGGIDLTIPPRYRTPDQATVPRAGSILPIISRYRTLPSKLPYLWRDRLRAARKSIGEHGPPSAGHDSTAADEAKLRMRKKLLFYYS